LVLPGIVVFVDLVVPAENPVTMVPLDIQAVMVLMESQEHLVLMVATVPTEKKVSLVKMDELVPLDKREPVVDLGLLENLDAPVKVAEKENVVEMELMGDQDKMVPKETVVAMVAEEHPEVVENQVKMVVMERWVAPVVPDVMVFPEQKVMLENQADPEMTVCQVHQAVKETLDLPVEEDYLDEAAKMVYPDVLARKDLLDNLEPQDQTEHPDLVELKVKLELLDSLVNKDDLDPLDLERRVTVEHLEWQLVYLEYLELKVPVEHQDETDDLDSQELKENVEPQDVPEEREMVEELDPQAATVLMDNPELMDVTVLKEPMVPQVLKEIKVLLDLVDPLDKEEVLVSPELKELQLLDKLDLKVTLVDPEPLVCPVQKESVENQVEMAHQVHLDLKEIVVHPVMLEHQDMEPPELKVKVDALVSLDAKVKLDF